ncbi:MAG: efflux RND transporter periplasmic adaptor subunit [Gemmataceae bacterium]|nr:efflux RND transporter periplasmic adaptor subunit [Gemmataceae bacterium]
MIQLKPGVAFAACVLGLLLTGCDSTPPIVQTGPPVVTVSRPLEKEIVDYDQYTGRIEAAETVEVRARVRGELTQIHFKDGDLVEGGEKGGKKTVLFSLDPRTYKAALAVAVAKKANAEASLKLAESEYERNYALAQTKAASARDVEVWLAKKGIALAEVGQAEADIERAKLDVEFTTIKAPISGRISRALVSKGNLVNTGGGDTLRTTIVSVDPIYVYFDVDERSLELYRERRAKELGVKAKETSVIPVFLGLAIDGDRFPREGKIDFAENRLNPATGTIRVRGVFANKDGRLMPGQFARVKLPVGKKYEALLVADQAIGIDQGQKYLLIVNDQNKVEYRPVTPGRLEGDLRIFPPGAGLKPGEWVIVNGVQRVRPGIEVRPEPVPMPTRSAVNDKVDPGKKMKK